MNERELKELTVSADRLDRVEQVLEKMADRLDQLIKLEVRHDNTVYRIDKMEEKVDKMYDNVKANSMITGATERFGWILVSAIVGLAAYFLR